MNLNQEKDPVARFMQDNRHEVPDDGFTERVMQQLPRRYERIALTLRVVGVVLAVVLFVALGGVEVTTGYCKNIYHSLLTGDWDNTQQLAPIPHHRTDRGRHLQPFHAGGIKVTGEGIICLSPAKSICARLVPKALVCACQATIYSIALATKT